MTQDYERFCRFVGDFCRPYTDNVVTNLQNQIDTLKDTTFKYDDLNKPVTFGGKVTFNGGLSTSSTPSSPSDLVTKSYVDGICKIEITNYSINLSLTVDKQEESYGSNGAGSVFLPEKDLIIAHFNFTVKPRNGADWYFGLHLQNWFFAQSQNGPNSVSCSLTTVLYRVGDKYAIATTSYSSNGGAVGLDNKIKFFHNSTWSSSRNGIQVNGSAKITHVTFGQ